MTLLDAPKFDEVRDQRNRRILIGAVGLFFVLWTSWWLVSGRPVDWPWNWNTHLLGRMAVNNFLGAVEKNDLPKAYGIWLHDKDWQQHTAQPSSYPFTRFQQDWSRTSPDNEYGVIQTHRRAQAHGGKDEGAAGFRDQGAKDSRHLAIAQGLQPLPARRGICHSGEQGHHRGPAHGPSHARPPLERRFASDRKSTRLNSSHLGIS